MSSNKIKVVILIDTWFPFYGGGQVHVEKLRKHLNSKYKVTSELFYSSNKNILIRFFWSLTVIFQVVRFHKNNPFSLIHSHGFIAGLPAKILSMVLKIPVVHTVHGSHLMDKGMLGPKAMMEKLLLTKIPYDAQITVSKGFLKYKNVNKKIYAIANGVDTADFSKVRVRKNSDPTLIWVGRLHPDKGVEYLKQAVVKARRKIPNLRTELVTGGRLYGAGLIRAYKKAHVFVLPSLAEGQPITLLEAWAAKLPVVVTEVGENPQMVKNGVNGFLVEPANVNQLAKYILKALRGKKLSKSMGIAGYKLVEKEYTWEKVADETYKVYKGLLE